MKKFDESELQVVRNEKDFFGNDIPVYNFPVSIKEGMINCYYKKKPTWMISDLEKTTFCPSLIADHGARGFVFEAVPYPREKFGGKDIFGIEWVYVDVAGGSMEVPGSVPPVEDASEWRDCITMPDIDSWDWEGSAEMNKEYLAGDKCNEMMFLNGCWYERLISFMGFENAAMALIDEDQEEGLKDMIHELTSLYMRIVDKCEQYFNLDGYQIHDDWGAQKDPFFSDEAARNIFLPEMKRFVDHVHSYGKYVELHSCGHIESRCDVFVDAGFDAWLPMPMNDTKALYEKYGDKIVIGCINDVVFDSATATEEEQRAAARHFVETYCKPGKPATYSAFYNAPGQLTPAFREELYKASREAYASWEE